MRHLISLKNTSKEDILELLKLALELKLSPKPLLKDKTLIMLFQKSSTRTRLSFEKAMTDLGGHAIFLDARTSQFSLTSFSDEIQAVMRFCHILMFRAKTVDDVFTAASFNKVPVIDACSEKYHPCQALSDLLTMVEVKGLENIKKVAWLGIENNVSNTLMWVCTLLGIEFAIAVAEADEASVDPELNKLCEETGLVTRTPSVRTALENADFVHTDTWMNMEFFDNGKVKPEFQEEYDRRKRTFLPYQLSAKVIDEYCPEAGIMHCMPLHVGYEISRDAIDHKNAVILDQAENRLHMQKAILVWLLDES